MEISFLKQEKIYFVSLTNTVCLKTKKVLKILTKICEKKTVENMLFQQYTRKMNSTKDLKASH